MAGESKSYNWPMIQPVINTFLEIFNLNNIFLLKDVPDTQISNIPVKIQ